MSPPPTSLLNYRILSDSGRGEVFVFCCVLTGFPPRSKDGQFQCHCHRDGPGHKQTNKHECGKGACRETRETDENRRILKREGARVTRLLYRHIQNDQRQTDYQAKIYLGIHLTNKVNISTVKKVRLLKKKLKATEGTAHPQGLEELILQKWS